MVIVFASQADDIGVVVGRVNDVLAGDCYSMRRARGADNSATFSANSKHREQMVLHA